MRTVERCSTVGRPFTGRLRRAHSPYEPAQRTQLKGTTHLVRLYGMR